MPTKNIAEPIWKEVQNRTIEVIGTTKIMVKDTELLQIILKKGLEAITNQELEDYIYSKNNLKEK
ncbi:hypothetical protein QJU87_04325 [Pasteurella skyensis]|uniref:hypothetical protein n=1 Tax=Phocoenobacter skyensis TaxID=97481 RepID=UPI00274F0520|nr:hypothetical protein [Pasteurella skyensis]MDP8189091.1 hypothetical protein [Pasteurella skyensis]